ncbi:MAG: HAMP domain-containing sensor histidine kinase, partial [Streptosporangiaceae bacterium]
LEHEQFDQELALTVQSSLNAVINAPDNYAAAAVGLYNGTVTPLNGSPALKDELTEYLQELVRNGTWYSFLGSQGGVFGINPSHSPALRAATRLIQTRSRSESGGFLPPGRYFVVVAEPAKDANSHTRDLFAAEAITGTILFILVLVGGRSLIGRGLAPLEKMASTADMITTRGDLTARMPDPGDNAEAGRLAAAINKMLDQIQQAFTARLRSEQKVRQFAADASHELRTPLTTIRGYAELYRQGALGPDDMPNAMRRIEQESERMSSLVAELLELARLDRDSSLNWTDVDLAEIARDAVADARAVEPDRPITSRVPAHLVVQADEPRLRQVFANLFSNIRAHTPARTPVTARLTRAFDGALLEVSDAGPGMEPADAARAFDRFHRGSPVNGSNGRGPGSGLGLSIVEAIATAHGGHARLLSTLDAGTTVQVWIPLTKPPIPERRLESATEEPAPELEDYTPEGGAATPQRDAATS